MKYELGQKFKETLEIIALDMRENSQCPYCVKSVGNINVSHCWYAEEDVDELFAETNIEHYMNDLVNHLCGSPNKKSPFERVLATYDHDDLRKWLLSPYSENTFIDISTTKKKVDSEKERINRAHVLRRAGMSFNQIAAEMNISVDRAKDYIMMHRYTGE